MPFFHGMTEWRRNISYLDSKGSTRQGQAPFRKLVERFEAAIQGPLEEKLLWVGLSGRDWLLAKWVGTPHQ